MTGPQSPPSSPTQETDYWLSQAQQVRLVAESVTDQQARLRMLKLAESYTRMAERAKNKSNG
jgi:hypothetical protein